MATSPHPSARCCRALLPRLRSDETAVLILTLAETTPVAESLRLEQDLSRAGVPVAAWISNRSFARIATESPLIAAKAATELPWIQQVAERHPTLPIVLLPWLPEQVAGAALAKLLA